MRNLCRARAKSRAPFPFPDATDASPTKVLRQRLARLVVVAEICPQVFLRVLGLLAQRDVVPAAVRFDRRPRSLRFEIDVDPLEAAHADIIAEKVGTIVKVRSTRWQKSPEMNRAPPR